MKLTNDINMYQSYTINDTLTMSRPYLTMPAKSEWEDLFLSGDQRMGSKQRRTLLSPYTFFFFIYFIYNTYSKVLFLVSGFGDLTLSKIK